MKALRSFLWLAALVAMVGGLGAQTTNLLLHGATHVRNGGQAWAYLIAQLESQSSPSTSIDLTKPEFSIYKKDGNPSDPANYELVGVMRPVIDEPTVSALLERSWQLKPTESPASQEASLGEKLDNMFGSLSASAAGQSVAAKLSNVIAAALADPQYIADLSLLGKTFPGVNLCMGMGWAGPISTAGPTTFEIRLRDSSGNDSAVTGRVTVDGSLATATPLPAPGEPVNSGIEVSTTPLPATAFSDFRTSNATETLAQTGFAEFKTQLAYRKLNRAVRLRWSTPVPLRQRAILQNGYNVWRIPASALDPSWLSTAPTLTELQAVSATKINRLPIMIPEELSPAEASDATDTETNFYTDEIPSGIALPSGEGEFVYFVSAVDILGRDGLVSTGTIVTICERMPPQTVKKLTVLNNYSWSGGSGEQRLHLAWLPVALDDGEGGAIQYEVFRWNRYDGPQRSIGAQPVFTTSTTSFADDITGSPTEIDADKTFWYTVRAVKVTGCGRFPGPHSSPVFGVIRDRKGPSIIDTGLSRPCLDPGVIAKAVTTNSTYDTTPGRIIEVTLRCTRVSRALAWAEFSTTSGAIIARVAFPSTNIAEHTLTFNSDTFAAESAKLANVRCRVGTFNGAISDYAAAASRQDLGKATAKATIPFEANVTKTFVSGGTPCPQGGQIYPIDPATDTYISGSGFAEADADAVEFKYYRRVDNGPLTFVFREELPAGAGPSNTSNFTDTNPPPINGGRVCYYVQAFDSNGNAGPLTLMDGSCTMYPPLAIPTPVLAKISSNPVVGNATATLKISWACPPVGVDRFKLYISKNGFVPPADLGIESLQENSAPSGGEVISDQGDKRFGVYLASRVEGRFSGNATDPPPANLPAEFAIDLPADNGATYTVAVRALGPRAYPADGGDATEGALSNVRDGRWSQNSSVGPNVPWPDRPIPPKIEPDTVYLGDSLPTSLKSYALSAAIKAEKFNTPAFDGIGVRVGELVLASAPPFEKGEQLIRANRLDPHRGLFRLAADDTDLAALFPCALYRHRIKNFTDAGISNDLVQVTPLMESIAYGFVQSGASNPAGPDTVIYDPFIATSSNGVVAGIHTVGIYLTDTLPVVRGATYRYLLVRFDPTTKEPRDVLEIPNSVTVP